jgi:hypothetical protein
VQIDWFLHGAEVLDYAEWLGIDLNAEKVCVNPSLLSLLLGVCTLLISAGTLVGCQGGFGVEATKGMEAMVCSGTH